MIKNGLIAFLLLGIVGCAVFLFNCQEQLEEQRMIMEEYGGKGVKLGEKILKYETLAVNNAKASKTAQRKIENYLRKLEECQN